MNELDGWIMERVNGSKNNWMEAWNDGMDGWMYV